MSFATKRELVKRRRRRRVLEAVARKLALAFTGFDPDSMVVLEHQQSVRIRGGFSLMPQFPVPLWTHFISAAEAVTPEAP